MAQYGIAVAFVVSYNEIIEFSAMCFELISGRKVDQFQSLVRPTEHSSELDFNVSAKTGILMSDLIFSPTLQSVLRAYSAWQATYRDYIICTWSDELNTHLNLECGKKNIEFPVHLRQWCDLQKTVRKLDPFARDLANQFDILRTSESNIAILRARFVADLATMLAKSYTIEINDSYTALPQDSYTTFGLGEKRFEMRDFDELAPESRRWFCCLG